MIVSRETSNRRCELKCEYLVIGSGIAGLSYALRVAQYGRVIIVTKKRDSDSATNLAQGGIAAVLGSDDSFSSHIQDTLDAGAGLCDVETVKKVVTSGRKRVEDLISYGVDFVKSKNNEELSLGREGGHSHRRVAHAYDLTGGDSTTKARLASRSLCMLVEVSLPCSCPKIRGEPQGVVVDVRIGVDVTPMPICETVAALGGLPSMLGSLWG